MPKAYTENPNSPPPQIRALNGTLPTNSPELTAVADMISQRDVPPPAEDETPPLPPVKEGPETVSPPAETPPAGQDGTPDDSTPGETQTGDEPENALSTSDNADLTEALKSLNADAQKHLLEMAQAVAKGETSIGELKRGYKLTDKFNQQIAALEQKIEELQQKPEGGGPAGNASQLPQPLAKLKTLQEVEERRDTAKRAVRFLEDFLDDNPNGGAINDQTYTRKEIREKKREWEAELELLPQRANELVAQQQFAAQRSSARVALETDYPWLADGEHAETREIKAFIKANPWVNGFTSPEYAAARMIRGEKALQQELAARKGKVTPVAKPAAGKVPLGKPHAAAAAGGKLDGATSTRSALDGVMKDGSTASLAQLLKVTDR